MVSLAVSAAPGSGRSAAWCGSIKARRAGERELLRLDQEVQVWSGIVPHGTQVVRLDQAQHLERRHALIVGRQLPHAISLEGYGNRLDPFGPMLAQIVEREVAAELRHAGDDPLAQLAAVQRGGSLRSDQPQAPGEIGIREPLALVRGA